MANGFETTTPQQYLKDRGITVDDVKTCFNCTFAEIDSDGEIWIEGPQTGHWIREHEFESLVKFTEAHG